GPDIALARAEVSLRAGQRAEALTLLEQLAKIPAGPYYGDLLGPRWDALRDDPRFRKIVADLAPPARH
ncbi:MAG: hypothetical protein M3Y86_03735, partial [Verrucomicrobiota bacterium]|nr:hypothetical protein [Verrucomicrobiota bacterium]